MLKYFKKSCLLIFLLFLSSSFVSAANGGADVKSLFDRYQSVFGEYREAVENSADEATVKNLSQKLKSAASDYYQALGIKSQDKKTIASEQQNTSSDEKDHSSSPQKISAQASFSGYKKNINQFEQEYNEILALLAAPDSEKHFSEIKQRLSDLIKTCTDKSVTKEAFFTLAELVFDSEKNLKKSQAILLSYARKKNISKEDRRQAYAHIKRLKLKAVIESKRNDYSTIQQRAANKWGSFSKSSWLAIPVKIWKLGSYLTTNVNRRFKARNLDKTLEEYDKAVLATYPIGSTDALTRSKIIPLNKVKMLVNGRTSFHYRMEHAKRAQSSIYLQTLLYQEDAVANKLTDILCQKAEEGVDVRVIIDDFFALGKKDGVIQRLKNSGVQVFINNPILKNIFKANFRSHQKLFVIDEVVAIVGGMNIGAEYANGEITEYGWRDTDVEVRGPIVREILNLFERNWEELTLKKSFEKGLYDDHKEAKIRVDEFKGLPNKENLIRGPLPVYFQTPPVFEDVEARFVTTAPIDEQDDNILDLFEVYLEMAEHEVIFESAYFIPTDRLKNAIRTACARGVDVIIITNSIESNNHPTGGWAGRESYAEILQAGARIFEWRGAQTLHSKVSLFDNFAVTLGAYNVNSRSHSSDSEDVLAIEDLRVAKAFKKMLMKDLSRCQEITMQDVRKWDKDFMKKAKMKFFNLFKFMF